MIKLYWAILFLLNLYNYVSHSSAENFSLFPFAMHRKILCSVKTSHLNFHMVLWLKTSVTQVQNKDMFKIFAQRLAQKNFRKGEKTFQSGNTDLSVLWKQT